MYLRLLRDLPFKKEHGAIMGRVFPCERFDTQGRGKKAWFVSDVGQQCAAYLLHECELFETREEAEGE